MLLKQSENDDIVPSTVRGISENNLYQTKSELDAFKHDIKHVEHRYPGWV